MHIQLIERITERCMDPGSPNYKNVTAHKSKVIDVYESSFVPRKGEVIFFDEDIAYDVVEVIYHKCACHLQRENIIGVMIEVTPHKAEHLYDGGNYSKTEPWPLVANLETDLTNFFEAIED